MARIFLAFVRRLAEWYASKEVLSSFLLAMTEAETTASHSAAGGRGINSELT